MKILSSQIFQIMGLVYQKIPKSVIPSGMSPTKQLLGEIFTMFYFKLSVLTFLVYFCLFLRDETTSLNNGLSWVALLFVSLTFPLSIPLSLLEIFQQKKPPNDQLTTEDYEMLVIAEKP